MALSQEYKKLLNTEMFTFEPSSLALIETFVHFKAMSLKEKTLRPYLSTLIPPCPHNMLDSILDKILQSAEESYLFCEVVRTGGRVSYCLNPYAFKKKPKDLGFNTVGCKEGFDPREKLKDKSVESVESVEAFVEKSVETESETELHIMCEMFSEKEVFSEETFLSASPEEIVPPVLAELKESSEFDSISPVFNADDFAAALSDFSALPNSKFKENFLHIFSNLFKEINTTIPGSVFLEATAKEREWFTAFCKAFK